MGVMRHIVFPALRLLVWGVIAVALSVIAFGGDRGGDGQQVAPLQPSADLSPTTLEVQPGSITSSIKVTGTVAADPAATVRSTAAGTVSRVHAKVGDLVESTTRLFDVRVPLEPAQQSTATAADGSSAPPRARFKTVTVTAGSTGTLATLAVLPDQEVTVGVDVATISPGTLSVSAPLTQAQQFRLLTPPATARAQASGGPAPFDCTDVRTSAAQSPSGPAMPDPYTGMVPETPTATVTCRVPPGTTVFAGGAST